MKVIWSCPFYRWRFWSTERLSNLTRVTQLIREKLGFNTMHSALQSRSQTNSISHHKDIAICIHTYMKINTNLKIKCSGGSVFFLSNIKCYKHIQTVLGHSGSIYCVDWFTTVAFSLFPCDQGELKASMDMLFCTAPQALNSTSQTHQTTCRV